MPMSLHRSIAPASTADAPSPHTHPRTFAALRHHLRSALIHWHLLSLDAPTVAVLWTTLFARSLDLPTPLRTLPALFLAVWILYAADRLLDAHPLDARLLDARRLLHPHPYLNTQPHLHPLEPRHRFHHTHRRHFRRALVLAGLLLATLLHRLPVPDLRLDLLLAAVLAVYFLLLHTGAAQKLRVPLPKELVVGLSFAAAATIPSLAQHPGRSLDLLPSSLLFAALCTLNCLLIHRWEHTPRTRLPISALASLVALAGLALGLRQRSLALLAISLSAALLLALDRHKHRLAPTPLRAAADLALLTPALFLFRP